MGIWSCEWEVHVQQSLELKEFVDSKLHAVMLISTTCDNIKFRVKYII